jgi:uncharacterized coiled-coil protein SlyX
MPNRTLEQRFADHEERLAHVEAVVERQTKELEIQFKRIAQLQAELDQKRMATDSVKLVIEPFSEKSD